MRDHFQAMIKDKSHIKYDIIGNQGFTFNSSTYNILNRDNTFWTTTIPMQSAELEIKFPANILTHIEFKNCGSPSLEMEIYNKNEQGKIKDEIVCLKTALFNKSDLHEIYKSFSFNFSDNFSIPKIPYTFMKIRLSNPFFEELQMKMGICYLFLYGDPKKSQESSNFKGQDLKKSNSKSNSITPFKPEIKSVSKNVDSEGSGKKSLEKSEKSTIEKLFKDRMSGVNEGNIKSIFKDRTSNTKDDKNTILNNLNARDYLKHISKISQQNEILNKKKIPEIAFPLRESILKNSGIFDGMVTPPFNKNENKQAKLENYKISSNKVNKPKTIEKKYNDELQKAIEESKRLYEIENKRELQEIQEIYAQIQDFEKKQESNSISSLDLKESKKRKDDLSSQISSIESSIKKIKNDDIKPQSQSQRDSMIPISELELSNTYIQLEKNL